jgi:pimeloyl-ACP methyl ester carboxylesterase
MRFSGDGQQVSIDPALATDLFYADAPAVAAAAAVARLRSVHRSVFRGVPATIGWRHRPSTYVVCADDRAVHPDRQRAMARRATTRLEWPCSHSPALTRPAEVAALIVSLAR